MRKSAEGQSGATWYLDCLANTFSPTKSGTFEQLFRP
jgi:hypothetical protein